ncbi:MAG: hypothetical protein ABRQ37_24580 [Candidatus Eremiobacterota bacterium]
MPPDKKEGVYLMKGQVRNPVVAGVLSAFLPGTGQIYNQDIIKGWIIAILCIVLSVTVIGSIIIWIYGIVDACIIAGKINRGERKLRLERNILYATLSSLICGWGQIYNGQTIKGLLMLICLVFLAPTGIGFIFMVSYGVFDAFYTAQKINRGDIETPFIKTLIYNRLCSFYELPEGQARALPVRESPVRQNLALSVERGDYHGTVNYGIQSLQMGCRNDPEIHRYMGKAYLYTGNYGFSALEFISALELGYISAEIYNNLASALSGYASIKKEDNCFYYAKLYLEKALNKDSNCWQAEINLINLLIIKRDLDSAGERCNRLLRVYPNLWQAEHCSGLILMSKGKKKEAKDIFRGIISKQPLAWESRVALGRICEGEKAEEQALNIYNEILEEGPPEIVVRGVTNRIKKLNSPDRKFLRFIFRGNNLNL